MKLLVLTYPFCGAHSMMKELAQDANVNFIQDPMNISLSKNHSGYLNQGNGKFDVIQYTGSVPRPYVFPNAVPNNTIITHNVGQHKLPGNRTEVQFLNDWTGSFDKVIGIVSEDREDNAKMYSMYNHLVERNNSEWKRAAVSEAGSEMWRYDNSYYSSSLKTELDDYHTTLVNYASANNITTSSTQELFVDACTPSDINNVTDTWGIGSIWGGIVSNTGSDGYIELTGSNLFTTLSSRYVNRY